MRMHFAGAKPAETLTGLVTCDVRSLGAGSGQFGAALTAKGKVIADVRIVARADSFLVDTSESAGPGFAAMIRKYVNPRLAKYADVSAVLRTVGVYGPRATTAVSAALGADEHALYALAPLHLLRVDFDGAFIDVMRSPDLGGAGYDLLVAVEHAAALWERLAAAGALPAGTIAANIARVEAGRPLWGVDMDENTLAQEANFDALDGISYTKGCYTGQETVARVHFRGHVNRHLRGLLSEQAVATGALLFADDGSAAGDVRSSVESPQLGAIAMAMVRREVEHGAMLTGRWEGGEEGVRVGELPFAPRKPAAGRTKGAASWPRPPAVSRKSLAYGFFASFFISPPFAGAAAAGAAAAGAAAAGAAIAVVSFLVVSVAAAAGAAAGAAAAGAASSFFSEHAAMASTDATRAMRFMVGSPQGGTGRHSRDCASYAVLGQRRKVRFPGPLVKGAGAPKFKGRKVFADQRRS